MLILAWISLGWTSFGMRVQECDNEGVDSRDDETVPPKKIQKWQTPPVKNRIFSKEILQPHFYFQLIWYASIIRSWIIQANLLKILLRSQTDTKQDKNHLALNLSKGELIHCRDIILLACDHSQPSELHF